MNMSDIILTGFVMAFIAMCVSVISYDAGFQAGVAHSKVFVPPADPKEV